MSILLEQKQALIAGDGQLPGQRCCELYGA